MKKITTFTLAACAIAALTACSATQETGKVTPAQPTATVTETVSATPSASQSTFSFSKGDVSFDEFAAAVSASQKNLTTWTSRMTLNQYIPGTDSVNSAVMDMTIDDSTPNNRKVHIITSQGESLITNNTVYRKTGSQWQLAQSDVDSSKYTTSFIERLDMKRPAIKKITYQGLNDKGLHTFVATVDVKKLLEVTDTGAENVPKLDYDNTDITMNFDKDFHLVYQELTTSVGGKKIDSTTLEQKNFNEPVTMPTIS